MTATAPTIHAMMAERGLSNADVVRAAAAAGHTLNPGVLSKVLAGRMGVTDNVGRALAAAFDVPIGAFTWAAPPSAAEPDMRSIPLPLLVATPDNERRHFDPEAIDLLAEDIRVNGLLQNLVVLPDGHGGFEVWAGERRRKAMAELHRCGDLPTPLDQGIPCRVLASREQALLATVRENGQREDVHYLDRGAALERLCSELKLSAQALSERLSIPGHSARAIQQLIDVHRNLPDDARQLALEGDLSFHSARDPVQSLRRAEAAPPPPPPAAPAADVPLPFTREDARAATLQVAKDMATTPRPAEEPVSNRVYRVIASFGLRDEGSLAAYDLLRETVPTQILVDGTLLWDIRQTFRLQQPLYELVEAIKPASTVGDLTRKVITWMTAPPPAAAPSAPPPKAETPRIEVPLPFTPEQRAQAPRDIPDEKPFPDGALAFIGLEATTGGIRRVWLACRVTGRRFVALPEQTDTEEACHAAD